MADKNKTKRTSRIIIFAVIVPIAIAYISLSLISFNITHKIPELREKIKPNLYGDINAEKLAIIFLPRPRIYIENFVLTNKSGPVVEADKMRITIKMLPLIYKKIIIKELIFTDADLFVIKRRDGTVNLQEIRKEKLLDIRLRGAKLINSTLRLVHELPQETFKIELRDLSAKLYPRSNGYTYIAKGKGPEAARLQISGDAYKIKGEWRVGGTMGAEDLQSSLFAPYMRLFDTEMKARGIIKTDLDFSYDKKTTIKGYIDYHGLTATVPRFHPNTISSSAGKADIDLTWSKDEINVSLRNATLNMDGFDISGSFSLLGPRESRLMHLNINTTAVDYLKIKQLVPYRLFTKKIRERIDKFDVRAGKIQIDELKINTTLNGLNGHALLKDSESFTMKLGFEGFDFKYENFNDLYSNIWGKLSFVGSDIKLKGFNGLYGNAKIENLDGYINGLAGKVTYKINILSSLDLKTSLGELKRLTRGALDKVSGSGPISLTLQLNGGGGKALNYLGNVVFHDTTLSHTSIPIKRFTSTNGSVGFEKNMLVFNDIKALSGGSSLSINGTVEGLSNKKPVYNLSLKGSLESVGLNSLLKGKLAEPVPYKFLIFYNCEVRGKRDDLAVKSTLDLSAIETSYKGILKKKKGFPLLMKVDTNVKGDTIDITRAIFNIGSSKMALSGNLNLKEHSYDIAIPRTKLKIKDLDNILVALKDDEWASGLIDLTLKATRSSKSKKTLLNGEISLADGFLSTNLLKARLEEVNLKALFNGNTGNITIDNITLGKSSATGMINIKDINKRVVDFEIDSEYLNTKDLSMITDRPKTVNKKSSLRGTGRINIKKGHLNKLSFKAFKAKVEIEKDSFNITPIIFSMNEGIVTGSADIFKDPASFRLYNANFKVRSVNLESLIKELGTDKKIVSGKLDVDLDLFGKRGTAIKDGLNGAIILNSRLGKLWKFPVMTKIFSLINIISINNLFDAGLEYKKISGNLKITDGIFFTDDLLFDSSSLRMSMFGRINYPENSIDATLGFHPFVTIDKIINMIPLAGWIISGKDKSAITMYYEIKGPLKDPNVQSVPVKSLGKGIFGILERTMKLPGQILSTAPAKDEKKKDEIIEEPAKTEP